MSAVEYKNYDVIKEIITLESFINRSEDLKISHKAYFLGFKQRMKVEFLKSFIV